MHREAATRAQGLNECRARTCWQRGQAEQSGNVPCRSFLPKAVDERPTDALALPPRQDLDKRLEGIGPLSGELRHKCCGAYQAFGMGLQARTDGEGWQSVLSGKGCKQRHARRPFARGQDLDAHFVHRSVLVDGPVSLPSLNESSGRHVPGACEQTQHH